MKSRRMAANAGQPYSALAELQGVLEASPLATTNLVQPVEITVGAVVLQDAGVRYVHVPYCSSRFRRSPVWKYQKGTAVDTEARFGFDGASMQFYDAPVGELGLLHFFGLFRQNADGGATIRPIAVEFLPTPGFSPRNYEFEDGDLEAAEHYCDLHRLGSFGRNFNGSVVQLMRDRAVVLQQPTRFEVQLDGQRRTLCDLGIPARFHSRTARAERSRAAQQGELLTMCSN